MSLEKPYIDPTRRLRNAVFEAREPRSDWERVAGILAECVGETEKELRKDVHEAMEVVRADIRALRAEIEVLKGKGDDAA